MAHADVRGDRIIVQTQWNERELVKQIPGARWDVTAKYWHLPLRWSSCIVLRGVFGTALTISDELNRWAWTEKRDVDWCINARTLIEPPADWSDVNPDRLYPFQAVGATFMGCTRETLLGDEMGTGKTVQVLTAIESYGDTLPAIVVCPNSVKLSWAQHAADWAPSATPYIITGGSAQREKLLKAAAADPYAIVIINFESLRTMSRLAPYGSTRLKRCRECDKKYGEEGLRVSSCQVHPKSLNAIPWATVVVDEAHRIKDPKSQQTRAVWAVAHQPTVHNRWALTGTPLANHPGDLWSILHCISPADFPTKTHFVDRYCLQSWNAFGGLDIVGVNPAARAEFFGLLDPRFRRMPKDLVLSQLPPKVRSTRWVDLTPSQAKAYANLEDTGATFLNGEDILVPSDGLIAMLRLMQLASASLVGSPDVGYRLAEPSSKLDTLEEILEELGNRSAVICAESRQLIDLAAGRLKGKQIGLITGTIPEYERQVNLRRFQAGDLQYLLFTVKAGGTGLTMTAADTMVRLQRSWSMIDNKQAEDRIHRIGSERHESVHIIDIVARDTVEEKQMASLAEKNARLEEIVRDRATLRAAGKDTYELDALEDAILRSEL
jgi:SNF2 family DNA or RNA helicase